MMMRQTFTVATFILMASVAQADLDGHGPDAWRVTGVASDDMLNARMGPGTEYKVIEKFAPDERGLQQITCVPYYAPHHYMEMSEAQIKALPPRWCLMRDAGMMRAGWVAQRFITPDNAEPVRPKTQDVSGDALIDSAQALVRDLYTAFEHSKSQADNPFMRPEADKYFSADVIPDLAGHGGDVLYDAQDFQGKVTRIAPDPDQPMFRGMISINVDFTNFGRDQRVIFRLRADTARPDAPFRIFRVDYDHGSFPG